MHEFEQMFEACSYSFPTFNLLSLTGVIIVDKKYFVSSSFFGYIVKARLSLLRVVPIKVRLHRQPYQTI